MAMQHTDDNAIETDGITPPGFRPAWWTLPGTMIGGDLQTVMAIRHHQKLPPERTEMISVGQDHDADQIALHVNSPSDLHVNLPSNLHVNFASTTDSPAATSPNVLLLHGITGCHAAPYMIRLASRLAGQGYRTFRMDARGCGVLRKNAQTITHAGRSDDVAAAIEHIADHHDGPINVIGMSLGGNQILRLAGRIGSGQTSAPPWLDRIGRIAAIAPPVDLPRCAENMERLRNRFYNRYFIAALFKRLPPAIRDKPLIQSVLAKRLPKTLRRFDDQVTAPLAGFNSGQDYYQQSSAANDLASIKIPTLIVASRDDPIVPIDSLGDLTSPASPSLSLLITNRGGHAGYLGRGQSTWLVDRLADWVGDKKSVGSHSSRFPHLT